MFIALIVILAPVLALVAAGVIAAVRSPRRSWSTVAVLLVSSSAVWLVYVGLYQHETPCGARSTGCPTVYGYDAPLPDEHPIGVVLVLVGFAVPAALVGWRRLAPAVTAGAALALGPTILAWWTAPRGDNDGLWGLIFLFLPVLGGLAAMVAAAAEHLGASRSPRSTSDRGRDQVVGRG